MQFKFLSIFSVLSTLIFMPTYALADKTQQMSNAKIKKTVNGKRIYLQTPFGGEFPLYYKTNGKVDGTGKALGLGRMMKPEDEGRWWIKNNKLCQQWETWYDGKSTCFKLYPISQTMLKWHRDDGKKGLARIGK